MGRDVRGFGRWVGGRGIDIAGFLMLVVATGFVAGWLTHRAAPLVGLIAGYGGAWAAYLWYYATFVGFREFDALGVPIAAFMVVLAAVAFGVARLIRRVVVKPHADGG